MTTEETVMANAKKKIKEVTFRFPYDEWRKFDNKRHAAELTWQTLGKGLLMAWLAGDIVPPGLKKKCE